MEELEGKREMGKMLRERIAWALVFFFVFFLVLSVAGCGGKPQTSVVYETVEVKVPVLEIPQIKPAYIPALPIESLNEDSEPGDIVSAYYNSVEILKRHVMVLEIQLRPFWDEYKKSKSH